MARGVFDDRRVAGRKLAELLEQCRESGSVVMALPRGGVPVAYEVARTLQLPLDVLVVRKLGSSRNPELALGAIAAGNIRVVDDDIVRAENVGLEVLDRIAHEEERELRRRERAYRGDRPALDLSDRTVLLVDDGLATTATMNAAVRVVERLSPRRVVVAVPVAPESVVARLRAQVDEVVCAVTPAEFAGVGSAYRDFDQTSDEEVRELLVRAAGSGEPGAGRAASGAQSSAEKVVPTFGDPAGELLLDLVGDARFVLIGEASHGTEEFYATRARMTRTLIEQQGFQAVAVEADWPDAYRVNRYVRGYSGDADAEQALDAFVRFPMWMWRNTVVRDFVAWLREHNQRAVDAPAVGFYGLDLYSMCRSAAEVVGYLQRVDPVAARRARERYACFDQHGGEQGYGYAAAFGAGQTCEDQVVEQLVELQRLGSADIPADEDTEPDERFYAEQNARLVTAAEQYYRAMFGSRVSSWNLRDEHMFRTLTALSEHLERRHGTPAKVVVWAHNSHVGDARASEMGAAGELNLGQLAREGHPRITRVVGFTTHTGTVLAADEWDGPARVKRVRPSLPGSVENLQHRAGVGPSLRRLDEGRAPEDMRSPLLERAIGVIYRPDTERRSHYFHARPADRFDALVHIDETTALTPLDLDSRRGAVDPGETYPHAI